MRGCGFASEVEKALLQQGWQQFRIVPDADFLREVVAGVRPKAGPEYRDAILRKFADRLGHFVAVDGDGTGFDTVAAWGYSSSEISISVAAAPWSLQCLSCASN